MIEILLPPFLLSVVLVGIHAFYGLEIIRRGIIFTDLAIGQMAALGAAISILFFHAHYFYPMALVFSLLGGILISLASGRERYLEAFIALLYAFATSATVLVLSKSPHGSEALQSLLAADILFTLLPDIGQAFGLYAVIAVVLYTVYRRSSGSFREVIFFTTFSVTVASSVQLAGVLVVFAMLVAPAFIAIKGRHSPPLLWAWVTGTLFNTSGVVISYLYDFPTGYMIVCIHASVAIIYSFMTFTKGNNGADPHNRTTD